MLLWPDRILVIVRLSSTVKQFLTFLAAVGCGKPFNKKTVEVAMQQLDNFARILQNEGIIVRR